MSLNAQVANAQRLAEKRGNVLYGFEVLDDGSVRGMETSKSDSQISTDLATDIIRPSRRGVVADRPVQGALNL
jgi:hypothetical protein